MRTTTVRFDDETFADGRHCADELGVSFAEFVRIATVQRTERHRADARLKHLEVEVAELRRGFELLKRFVNARRWTRAR